MGSAISKVLNTPGDRHRIDAQAIEGTEQRHEDATYTLISPRRWAGSIGKKRAEIERQVKASSCGLSHIRF